jgi:hypothetical protein
VGWDADQRASSSPSAVGATRSLLSGGCALLSPYAVNPYTDLLFVPRINLVMSQSTAIQQSILEAAVRVRPSTTADLK